MRPEDLLPVALALPISDRAKLAQELLRSLDLPENESVTESWVDEITRRARELADGSVQAVDWEIARERIVARLRGSNQ